MAIAMALVCFAGFAPSYYLKAHFATPQLKPLLHFHGLVFTMWMVLMIVQTSLISGGLKHRALAAGSETFGSALIRARLNVALRMLEAPLFDRVTTAEIGRRAGFPDASHFVRVMRKSTGQTPLQLRRTRNINLHPGSAEVPRVQRLHDPCSRAGA